MRKILEGIRLWLSENWAALLLGAAGMVIIVLGFSFVNGQPGTWNPGAFFADFVTLETFTKFANDLYANAGAELISIAITVIVIEGLNKRREKRANERSLLARIKSTNNAVAIGALEEMRAQHLLYGESSLLHGADLERAYLEGAGLERANLEGAVLMGANLEGAGLGYAKLHGVDLEAANLKGAVLARANLEGANLRFANLEGVDLLGANLEGANLRRANLEGAFLRLANLEGAVLGQANLEGAFLWGANLDDVTWQDEFLGTLYTATLPDGTEWTDGTDMGRFTDMEYPQYEETLEKVRALREELRRKREGSE